MRLRTLTLIGLSTLALGGGVWLYARGTGGFATGASGLPLIKADLAPVKVPPEEPGGEVVPNADSTVFTAMGEKAGEDPSMKNVEPPAQPALTPPRTEAAPPAGKERDAFDFAGFRTGFSLPREPARKTESLFAQTSENPTQSEAVAPAEEGVNDKYFAGMAGMGGQAPVLPVAAPRPAAAGTPAKKADSPAEKAPEKAPAPPKQAAEAKPQAVSNEPDRKAERPLEPVLPLEKAADDAKAMEAQEKTLALRPSSKPALPPVVQASPPEAVEKTAKASQKEDSLQQKAPKTAPKAQDGAYYIQLASAREGADTQAIWNGFRARHPAALSGLQPSFQPVAIPGKGTYVRVQAGPLSQGEATRRCTEMRAADPKGGCLVVRR